VESAGLAENRTDTTSPEPDDPGMTRSGDDEKPPSIDSNAAVPKRKRPRWLTAIIVVATVLLGLAGGGLVAVNVLSARYEGRVTRMDILDGVPQPPAVDLGDTDTVARQAMNFLVLGSDSRAQQDTQALDQTGSRSDTIMLVHVNKERTGALVISIPRDSYVDVPAGGNWPGGKNKINAALAYGGANLAARTVYNLTQVPLNGAMIVNFDGLKKMVAAVGGVNVCTPFAVQSSFSSRYWGVGCHDMTPDEAEEFMRQRKNVPGGDFGRIKNQQNVIKGLMKKVTTTGVLANPLTLDRLITTAAESLTVDKGMNLRDLAFALKGIDPANVKFATVPVAGTMTTDAGSSVQLDTAGVAELFEAVRGDRTDEWLATHPQPDVARG
jgi:LCP family protein required for cell wall assembly